jgi:signal-transduction protein with cAMP-binding, CBS, and nucleotidyltransferase domain
MGNIEDVLRTKGTRIHTISPDATVYEAIERMVDRNVGSLIVTYSDGPPLGIVTERDYLKKVALLGRTSRATAVREIMSPAVMSVGLRDDVDYCLGMMTEYRVRHLPVVARGKLIGIVSVGDLVKYKLGAQRFEIDQMTLYIQGYGS